MVMQKNTAKRSVFIFALIFCFSLCAQENGNSENIPQVQEFDAEKNEKLYELLSGYLENDLDLQRYIFLAKSSSLAFDSAKIENGISVTLSTGNVNILSSTENMKISVTPQGQISMPSLNDTSISASFPLNIENDGTYVSNGSISVTTGIINNTRKQNEITLLEAKRAYLEAEQNVRDRALKAETEFYEDLKALYEYSIEIYTLKGDLYEDSLDLRVLETQGYSKNSAQYRQAELKVQSDLRNINEKERILERETAVFAMRCGTSYSKTTDTKNNDAGTQEKNDENLYSVLSFLPESIPYVEEVNIFDFDAESFISLESANWEKYIGEKKRAANYDNSLDASAGYIFNDSFFDTNGTNSNSDSVEAKLIWSWRGLSASAGVGIPTGMTVLPDSSVNSSLNSQNYSNSFNPYYSFSFQISPEELFLSKIEKEQDKIDIAVEDIEIRSAKDDYETTVFDKVSTFHDIKWTQKSYEQQYSMYVQLEKDMALWLEQGIVTESDYLDAFNNREKTRLNIMINAIDQIIFNNDVKLLFCTDEILTTR